MISSSLLFLHLLLRFHWDTGFLSFLSHLREHQQKPSVWAFTHVCVFTCMCMLHWRGRAREDTGGHVPLHTFGTSHDPLLSLFIMWLPFYLPGTFPFGRFYTGISGHVVSDEVCCEFWLQVEGSSNSQPSHYNHAMGSRWLLNPPGSFFFAGNKGGVSWGS